MTAVLIHESYINMKSMYGMKFGLAAVIILVISAAAVKAESHESGDTPKPESKTRYRHLTLGFDWGTISTVDAGSGKAILPLSVAKDMGLRNQFSLFRIGYHSHRGGGGILGYGYSVNIGIALSGDFSSRRLSKPAASSSSGTSGTSIISRPRESNSSNIGYSYGFGKQLHVGQFFGLSFKIIDTGSIRWFSAVGLSMDIILGLPILSLENVIRSGIALGPQLNTSVTYMINPSFGVSLGANFTYYFIEAFSVLLGRDIEGPSGGFGVFFTFAR